MLIDRNGYFDRGRGVVGRTWRPAPRPTPCSPRDERYIALDLSSVRKADVPRDRLPRLGASGRAATAGVPRLRHDDDGVQPRVDWWILVALRATAGHVSAVGRSSSWSDGRLTSRISGVAGDVDVMIRGRHEAFPAFYGVDRPDVSAYLGLPAYRGIGFHRQARRRRDRRRRAFAIAPDSCPPTGAATTRVRQIPIVVRVTPAARLEGPNGMPRRCSRSSPGPARPHEVAATVRDPTYSDATAPANSAGLSAVSSSSPDIQPS